MYFANQKIKQVGRYIRLPTFLGTCKEGIGACVQTKAMQTKLKHQLNKDSNSATRQKQMKYTVLTTFADPENKPRMIN